MATENKTKVTDASVEAFLNSVENETRRQDGYTLLNLMQEITGKPAVMWGDTMIGFGQYHYRYASGREGDSFITGFSPRKQQLTVYIVAGLDRFPEHLKKLGKHKASVSCLYLNKLSDVDIDVLREMIVQSVAHMRETYPTS